MVKNKLSRQDVDKLLTERSIEARVETAAKLAAQFDSGELSPSERRLAADILRLMAHDADVRVRQSLSIQLKESPTLPHDLALHLAQDVDTVALPILQFSHALTDDDLIKIVRGREIVKQLAITRRASVSSTVSEAIVETGTPEVVVSLVSNEGADISEESLQAIVDAFGKETTVQGSLANRSNLPVTVAERLVTMVSDQWRDHLISRYQLSGNIAADLTRQSRERATISLSAGADREDVEGLVRHLNNHRRLTPSIMLRAVCMGDTTFFEAGMAELGGVPLVNAQILIHDSGELGFKAIYEKAKLPATLFPAFRCALDVAHENAFDGGEQDRERYCRRMIERILTQYEKHGVSFDSTDLEYLLAKLDQLP
ncbi:hypothetical protein CWS72_25260 [Telmatospirillum siberiense]|uniref:DUF2336 domain-containing protein n=2 Tax=Telmatospirillum siberiense TaxID=382514 RepID=A0A2N3PMY0_9PROT|nr:DUF2336 domain-containing protein [Telmatospirillum siberiense]PKU21758.1 hypothetical protein CWS72_25260 [Telmatospirillum siberiense]